jgi:hypothetical protein
MIDRALIALAQLAAFAEPAVAQSPPHAIHQQSSQEQPGSMSLHYGGQSRADGHAKAVNAASNLTSTRANP